MVKLAVPAALSTFGFTVLSSITEWPPTRQFTLGHPTVPMLLTHPNAPEERVSGI